MSTMLGKPDFEDKPLPQGDRAPVHGALQLSRYMPLHFSQCIVCEEFATVPRRIHSSRVVRHVHNNKHSTISIIK